MIEQTSTFDASTVVRTNAITPRKESALWRLTLMLLVACCLLVTSKLFGSHLILPVVSTKTSSSVQIDQVLQPAASYAQCERILERAEAVAGSSCSNCEVRASCLEISSVEAWLKTYPSSSRATVVDGSPTVFTSSDKSESVEQCELRSGNPPCLPLSEFNSLKTSHTPSLVIFGWFFSGLLLFSATLITLAIWNRRRVNRKISGAYNPKRPAAFSLWISDVTSITTIWLTVSTGSNFQSVTELLRTSDYTTALLAFLLTAWFAFGVGHYGERRALTDELWQCLLAIALVAACHLFIAAQFANESLLQVAALWGAIALILPTLRYLTRTNLDDFGMWRIPVNLIAEESKMRDAVGATLTDFTLGYRVESTFLLKNDFQANRAEIEEVTQALLASKKQSRDVDHILIAVDTLTIQPAHQLSMALRHKQFSATTFSLPTSFETTGMRSGHLVSYGNSVSELRGALGGADYAFLKRIVDLLLASIALVVLSPLLITLGCLVRKDGGPALYSHEREGRHGESFGCLKFRSMRINADHLLDEHLKNTPEDAEEWERTFKLKNDPRITRLGKFIRETSLDELPQLINVLKGEMSLVGPRPVPAEELEIYGEYKAYYQSVRPGITGLWQISGRNDTTYRERISLDVWYVQNWSMLYDVAILTKTIRVVLNKHGAY